MVFLISDILIRFTYFRRHEGKILTCCHGTVAEVDYCHFQQLSILICVFTLRFNFRFKGTYFFCFSEVDLNIAFSNHWKLCFFTFIALSGFELVAIFIPSLVKMLWLSATLTFHNQNCARLLVCVFVVNLPVAQVTNMPCLQHPAGQCWKKESIQLPTVFWLQFPL